MPGISSKNQMDSIIPDGVDSYLQGVILEEDAPTLLNTASTTSHFSTIMLPLYVHAGQNGNPNTN